MMSMEDVARTIMTEGNWRDFSADDVAEVVAIASGLAIDKVYPDDFGATPGMMDLGSILLTVPTPHLSAAIEGLHAALKDADPEGVMRNRGIVARFTGRAAEVELRYRLACQNIDSVLGAAQERISTARAFLQNLALVEDAHVLAIRHLRTHLAGGRCHLATLQDVPDPENGATGSPRDRFSKRLANIAIILQSTQLALAQIQMMRGQIIGLIDRLAQASDVLVTVWRNHALAVFSQSTVPSDLAIAYASATKSLKG